MSDAYSLMKALGNIDFGLLSQAAPIKYDAFHFSTASNNSWLRAIEIWRIWAEKLIGEQPKRTCPACGSDQSDPIYISYDLHTYNSCQDCGCWHVPYVVDNALFEKLFEQSPEAREVAKKMAKERLSLASSQESDRARFVFLLNLLGAFTKSSLLDIGANAGQFVAEAQERGWQAFGLEADVFALKEAESLGRFVVNDINMLPLQNFDLITLWETLEHIADPCETLNFVKNKLAKGGAVVMTMPNLNNLELQQMRGDCPYSHGGYNTPGHINFFGKSQLEVLLNRSGLQAIFFETMYASNFIMQFAYLNSKSQGARQDLFLQNKRTSCYPAILGALGPYFAMLERVTDTGPILFCVACHADEENLHITVAERLRQRKNFDIELFSKQNDPAPFNPVTKIHFYTEKGIILKPVVCAQNQTSSYLNLAVKYIRIASSNLHVSFNISQLQSYPGAGKKTNLRDTTLIEADNAATEYLLYHNDVQIPGPGQYSLEICGASTAGYGAVGLLDTASGQWFVEPQTLPLARSAQDFFDAFIKAP